jgi:hypothetical protein
MSNVRRSSPRGRILLALALLTGAIAACDASPTAPAGTRRAPTKPAAIEGDTLRCLSGWVIITGVYVCNEEF